MITFGGLLFLPASLIAAGLFAYAEGIRSACGFQRFFHSAPNILFRSVPFMA